MVVPACAAARARAAAPRPRQRAERRTREELGDETVGGSELQVVTVGQGRGSEQTAQRHGPIGHRSPVPAAIVVLTPGYQLFQAANTTTALAEVTREQRGAAAGLLGLSRTSG